jgi:hypothetical protein
VVDHLILTNSHQAHVNIGKQLTHLFLHLTIRLILALLELLGPLDVLSLSLKYLPAQW